MGIVIFLVLVYYHWQFVELKNLHRQPRQPWASRWTKINQPGCLFQCCFVNFLFSFSLSPLPRPFIAVLMVPVGRTSPWCVHTVIVHQISFVLTVPLLISPENGALLWVFNSEPLSFPLPFLCQHSSVGFDGRKKENFWLSLIPQNYTEKLDWCCRIPNPSNPLGNCLAVTEFHSAEENKKWLFILERHKYLRVL